MYTNVCKVMPDNCKVIVQNMFQLSEYALVMIKGSAQLQGLLDSGSMACMISEEAERRLMSENILTQQQEPAQCITLVGCGGVQVSHKSTYDMELSLYGVKCMVQALVVAGQKDDIIVDTNMLKYLLHQLKNDNYWTHCLWCLDCLVF